jgi:AcrR family transcriptional regulator
MTGAAPTTTSDPRPTSPRSPRSTAAEQSIIAATRDLLAEVGVHGLTVEGVAARAGVAKTTIYRRWRSKDELAMAVLLDMVRTVVAVPDLHDTRQELVAFVQGAVNVLGTTLMGKVMQGLVSELATNPELARAFRERVVALRVAEVSRLVERGIGRGDIRAGVDVDLVHEMLFGPVYYRLFLSGAPLEDGLAERIVAALLPGLQERDAPARGQRHGRESGGTARTV